MMCAVGQVLEKIMIMMCEVISGRYHTIGASTADVARHSPRGRILFHFFERKNEIYLVRTCR